MVVEVWYCCGDVVLVVEVVYWSWLWSIGCGGSVLVVEVWYWLRRWSIGRGGGILVVVEYWL